MSIWGGGKGIDKVEFRFSLFLNLSFSKPTNISGRIFVDIAGNGVVWVFLTNEDSMNIAV